MARDGRGRFASQADRIAAELTTSVERVSIALTLQVDANLRRAPSAGGTPVDTNHARASWIPSVGAPSSAEAAGGTSGAHDAGLAVVIAYKLAQGDALYVSNNAPYIASLNLGHSKQAPPGFIEACIDAAVATIRAKYPTADIASVTTGFADVAGGNAAANVAASYSPFADD